MADDGDTRALRVLQLKDMPGNFFTVVQIGVNAVAILAGVIGDSQISGPLAAGLVTGCRLPAPNVSAASPASSS